MRSSPSPSGKIKARVRACAVCGYDVRVFRNGHRKVKPPIILGHEICAELLDAIKLAEGELAAGTRVVIYPQVPCLECRLCAVKQYNACANLRELGSTVNGGFAEYVEIPEHVIRVGGVIPVPSQLGDEQAALLEPLACCLNSVSRIGLSQSTASKVAIIGDGPIGLMHVQLCKQMKSQVCVIGRIKSRMQKAKEFGADIVLEYQAADPTSQAANESFSGTGADFVVVATSNPSAVELAEKIAGKNSVINLFAGMPPGHMLHVDANRIHYNQTSIIGTFGCTPSLMSRVAEMASNNEIDLSSLITHRYSLSEVERALVDVEKYAGLRGVINRF